MSENQSSASKSTPILLEDVSTYGYNFDELGKAFEWEGKIYRLIYSESIQYVKELLDSGLIYELSQKGLFPKTRIADINLEGYDFVLEHEKIQPVVYPVAWSFDMLKDAGLCVLEVNKIARKYGYQTIDSHGFNILFNKGKAIFIDLGSFVKNDENPKGWVAYEEFLRYYLYPLRVFKSGNLFLGRAILTQGKQKMTHSSYYTYRYPLLRLISSDKLNFFFESFHKFKNASHFPLDEVEKRTPKPLLPLMMFMSRRKIRLFQNVNLNSLSRKIRKISLPKSHTKWGNYHDNFFEKDGRINTPTERFNRLLELIKPLNPKTVIEVGGNQGMFSQFLLQNTSIQSIICTDYDEIAVNKMYNRLKSKNLPITPSILDIVSPIIVSYGKSLPERYRCEMIMALALTHHLILTQKIPLALIFKQFSRFSSKYVVTEFMPLGLYNEKAKRNPVPPDWYTEEWFETEFKNHYKLIVKEQLEKNRIVFIGEKI